MLQQEEQIQSQTPRLEFTVGICAALSASGIDRLLGEILEETYSYPFVLGRVVVVASECVPESLLSVKEISKIDNRLVLIEESVRKGKADAINKIIQNSVGEYLVFVNSDAFPERKSISQLLQTINKDISIGIVSGCPVFDPREGLTSKVLQLMWLTHNECSKLLNEASTSNHCSDELMIVRAEALRSLPRGLVNDGAYIVGMAKREGYGVKFCERSKVRIQVPRRISDVISQRRRISYGHIQVWKLTGTPPKTLEFLFLFSPLTSLRILTRVLARHSELIFALPVGFVEEMISSLLAIKDNLLSTKRHAVWKKV